MFLKYCGRSTFFFFFLIPPQISATTIFFSSHFRQWHCHKKKFLLFQQWHCHKPIVTFFFPPISAMPLSQANCNIFFFLLFWQCHCHKSIPQFYFLFFGEMMCTQFLQQILSNKLLLVVIVGLKK